ncbi:MULTISPECIES: hypothetical protein [Arthrobacter]|uniref:Uncharacterized protein n=2 Tax=Arthrobacter TaxID=1663 RepID=A0ABU9KLL1_9MICC|nr:hypothetical protein [Arthrobacter sp. YJM1]MDP5227697.1 hypothetical protein [Arthrobacter sp. YJM1]
MAITKKLILGVTGGALALGAVTGLAGTAIASTAAVAQRATPAAAVTAQPTGKHGQENLAQELAAKLGIEQNKVEAALKSFRQANPRDKGAEEKAENAAARKAERTARQDALVKSLASSLGVSESKVNDAFASIRSDHQAQRTAALKKELDAAVASGKLTQAEEDAVLKADGLGLLGGAGHRD